MGPCRPVCMETASTAFSWRYRVHTKFKDAWVQHNKTLIISTATRFGLPPELLAGVCWIEVGGDPSFIDRIAFEIRSIDWSGPPWIDRNLTMTNDPAKTSFDSVSIQLRTASQTLGLNSSAMSTSQLRSLAICLQKDIFNIEIVARHLRHLIDHDRLQTRPPKLTMDQVRIVGVRYIRGIGLSLNEIKKNTSYGNFIVKLWPRFAKLLK